MPRRNHPDHPPPGRNRSARAKLSDAAPDHAAKVVRFARTRHDIAPDNATAAVKVICPSGKVGFARHVAQERLDSYQAQANNRASRPVRIYECDKCGYYHLTSRTTPPRL